MTPIEYKVVPAPTKAKRGRWIRSSAGCFAERLQQVFNEQAQKGWEYVRTDTLPCEERQGLTQKVTTYQNLLVFKRQLTQTAALEDHSEKRRMIQGPDHFGPAQEVEPQTLFEAKSEQTATQADPNVAPIKVEKPQESAAKNDSANVVTPAAWFTAMDGDDMDAEVIEEISPALLSRLKQVTSNGAA